MSREELNFQDISDILDSPAEEIKSEAEKLREKIGVNPLSDVHFRNFLSSLFLTGSVNYPILGNEHLSIEYFSPFRRIVPKILENSGRAELKKVYAALVGLIISHLEYTPQREMTGFRQEIVDFHHGSVGPGESYETTFGPAYSVSQEGIQKIGPHIRQLAKTYPVVEVLEEILRKPYLSVLRDTEGLDSKELSIVYRESSRREHRINAGKQLGYSDLRIFAHEHPVEAAIAGVVTVGAAFELGYILYKYLSK